MAEIKDKIITMRVTEKTKNKIKELAIDAGMNMTFYLMICGLGKDIIRINGLEELLTELKAQGRNLNQLTTLANMGQISFVRGDELIDLYGDLMLELKRITEVIG